MSESSQFSWGRLVALFRPHRRRVGVVTIFVLASAGVGIVNPLLIKVVFDEALFPVDQATPDVELLVVLSAIMLGVAVLGGVLASCKRT